MYWWSGSFLPPIKAFSWETTNLRLSMKPSVNSGFILSISRKFWWPNLLIPPSPLRFCHCHPFPICYIIGPYSWQSLGYTPFCFFAISMKLCHLHWLLMCRNSLTSDGTNVLLNRHVGHLVRTKRLGVDEGGVASGYSMLDTPRLIDWCGVCVRVCVWIAK